MARPWLSQVLSARGLARVDTGAVPLAVRAGQQSTGSSNLRERRPHTRQKQQGCHQRAHGEAGAARSGRQSCKLLRAPPRDMNLVYFHQPFEIADGRRAAVRTGTSRVCTVFPEVEVVTPRSAKAAVTSVGHPNRM